jgi:hypothetical protein
VYNFFDILTTVTATTTTTTTATSIMSDDDDDDSDCSQRQVDQQMHAIMHPPPLAAGVDDAFSAVAAVEENVTDDALEMAVAAMPNRQPLELSPTATGRDSPMSLESSDDDSPPGGAPATNETSMISAMANAATATDATTATTAGEDAIKKRGRPSLGGSTARSTKNAKKKQAKQDRGQRCQKGARVKVTRGNLYHALIDDDQKKAIEKEGRRSTFMELFSLVQKPRVTTSALTTCLMERRM